MLVIGGSSNPELAQRVALRLGCNFTLASSKKFANRELEICLSHSVMSREVIICQPITKPVNDNLMELLLLADAAKNMGCNKVIAFMPYFAYSRQDKPAYAGGAIAASLVAKLLEAAGVDEIITIDAHSPQLETFFNIKVHNWDATDLCATKLQGLKNCIIVSPDVGGMARAKALAVKLGLELAVITKKRAANGVCIATAIAGDVRGKNCIIRDDILASGSTLCAAAHILKQNGALSLAACVTHALFSGDCVAQLQKEGFRKLWVANVAKQQNFPRFIEMMAIDELFLMNAV